VAFSIKNPEADRLVRELTAVTGETLTEAIIRSVQERILREQGKRRPRRIRDELRAIRRRCSRLPVLDPRSPDEILGYDESGLPR